MDLLDLQIRRLRMLAEQWRANDPEQISGRAAIRAAWEHGSIGKLILEHSAMLVGAEQDALRVLERTDLPSGVDVLSRHLGDVVSAVDEVWEVAKGVHPIDLSHRCSVAVDHLLTVLDDDLAGRWAGPDTEAVVRHLHHHRQRLRSARHIRSHSPSHPSTRHPHRRFAPLLRCKVAFDRLRGYPWAESSAFGDTRMAREIDEA